MGEHGWAHVMLWVGMGEHRSLLMVMVWVWIQIQRKTLGSRVKCEAANLDRLHLFHQQECLKWNGHGLSVTLVCEVALRQAWSQRQLTSKMLPVLQNLVPKLHLQFVTLYYTTSWFPHKIIQQGKMIVRAVHRRNISGQYKAPPGVNFFLWTSPWAASLGPSIHASSRSGKGTWPKWIWMALEQCFIAGKI
jgi:hypothetical protein